MKIVLIFILSIFIRCDTCNHLPTQVSTSKHRRTTVYRYKGDLFCVKCKRQVQFYVGYKENKKEILK